MAGILDRRGHGVAREGLARRAINQLDHYAASELDIHIYI